MSTITKLGKELRKLRLDLGITLFEMGQRIGVSSGMLSSVETGRKPAPADLIAKLSKEFVHVASNRELFEDLALQTRGEVKLRLDQRPSANELAVAFARKFDTLSEDDIADLMAVFKRK